MTTIELAPLPYAKDALEPYVSAETVEVHYEKHHRGYVEKLRKLLEGKEPASLEDLVMNESGPVFEQAAQVWNHDFYWRCMKDGGGGAPAGALAVALRKRFGSLDAFREKFTSLATGLFGSGYLWLCMDRDLIDLRPLSNADNPLRSHATPLLTIDLWEHAYYLDRKNDRPAYVRAFLEHLVDWEFVGANHDEAISHVTRAR